MSTATHVRQHNSILAAAEKRALIWMATRLPRWVNSDHLSALGLASMAGAGAAFVLAASDPVAGASLVVLCLLLNWFGDSLDGTLARVRDQQRPRYGYYVDHVIDLAGTAMLFAGLAASGYMSRPLPRWSWRRISSCRPRPTWPPTPEVSSRWRSLAWARPSCASCWPRARWRSINTPMVSPFGIGPMRAVGPRRRDWLAWDDRRVRRVVGAAMSRALYVEETRR